MKKVVFIMLVALMSLGACTGEKISSFEQLPVAAQSFVNTYFSRENVSIVILDKELFSTEYEVTLVDGTHIKFNKNGELNKIDCKMNEVPEGVVPESVMSQIRAQFPNNYVVEWGKNDGRYWKAELNNDIELKYNSSYQLVDMDD